MSDKNSSIQRKTSDKAKKGKRFKKNTGKKKSKGVAKQDLEWLSSNTKYSPSEVLEWHKGFMHDCPDGKMDREKIRQMFSAVLPMDEIGTARGDAGDAFLDNIFRIFDQDGDGTIDFKEFMIATDMTSASDPEEKLRLAFRMYDKDGSGNIDQDEMCEIFNLMYTIQGMTEAEATERAQIIFQALDKDGDGDLTEAEFIKGCLADEELLELLNAGPV